MSQLSRLQALLERLSALAGSGDEASSRALAKEAQQLFHELGTVQQSEDTQQWG